MRAVLLLVAALVWAGPATASPTLGAAPPSAATIDAEQAAMGQWLRRLVEIEQPVQNSLAGLQSGVQSVMNATDIPRAAVAFRPTIARLLATVDEVDARLAELDTPEFPALGIPPDLRPTAVKRAMLQMNAAIRTGFQSYLPVLDAVARRDLAAARAAGARSMTSMRQMLDLQLLLARASQAPFPQDWSMWNMLEMPVLYSRTAVRIGSAWPGPWTARDGAALARDLRGLADELDRTAENGAVKAAAELTETNAILAEAERRGDSSIAAVLRRRIVVITHGQAFFPLSRDFAALLRRIATGAGNRPLSDRFLVEAFLQLAPIRDRMQAVVVGLSLGLGGS